MQFKNEQNSCNLRAFCPKHRLCIFFNKVHVCNDATIFWWSVHSSEHWSSFMLKIFPCICHFLYHPWGRFHEKSCCSFGFVQITSPPPSPKFGQIVPLFLNAKNVDLSVIQNDSLSKILLK